MGETLTQQRRVEEEGFRIVNSCPQGRAEDGIRDVERSRGLGDVYKRQPTGGSSGEYWAMGETLTQQRRVKEEGLRVVNFF